MIQIISGRKGKGKTKVLLDYVSKAIEASKGNIVYIDKSSKNMYQINSKVRLINISEFQLDNEDEFLGFISGILSRDRDIEEVYLDSFLRISFLENNEDRFIHVIERLEKMSMLFNVKFVLSISKDEKDLPKVVTSMIAVSL